MKAPLQRIGDLADQIRGVTYRKQDATLEPKDGFLPVLRAGNITNDGLTYDDLVYVPENKVSARQRIKQNDIIIAASSGSIEVVGKAARAVEDYEGGFGAFCKVLRPHDDIDPAYFSHYFKTTDYRRRVSFLAAGANINNLRNEDLDGLQIPLPPLPEQKRIAAILDAADELRTKRRESLRLLDDLIQSTFLEMFGDPVINPMGWDVMRLPDFVADEKYSLKRGPFGGALKKEIFVTDGFKVYEQKHVIYDNFDIGEYFINDHDFARLIAFKLKPSDLLISCSGTIGKIAEVPENARIGVMNQALLKIQLDKMKMLNPFFIALWRSQPFENHVLGMTHGTGMKNMKSMAELKSIDFINPPLDLQNRFVSIVDSIEAQKTRLQSHLDELDTLFASLQQRAFNGEL